MSEDKKSHEDAPAAEEGIDKPCVDASKVGRDIKQALHRSKSFPETIGISVKGSEINLTGTVLSTGDRNTAEATAAAEPGAKHVKSDINVP